MDKAEAVISAYLTHIEQRGKPRCPEDAPVESLVHASDALAQQLMECVSHDRALEDVLYEVSLSFASHIQCGLKCVLRCVGWSRALVLVMRHCCEDVWLFGE